MNESSALLFVALFVVVSVIIATLAVLLIVRLRKSGQRNPGAKDEPFWRRMARAFGSAITPRDETRTHAGVPYRYTVHPGSKNAPPSLTIAIQCASPGEFEVRKENSFDRLFKRLGVAVEIQTGDPAFDAEYYINTNTPDFARAFFGDLRMLAHVRRICDAGFKSVKCDGKSLSMRMQPLAQEPDEAVVQATVSDLANLANGIPESPSLVAFADRGWKSRRAAVGLASAAIYAAGIACLAFGMIQYPPLDTGPIFLDSLQYGMPALVLYAAVSVLLLRGRSGSHIEIVIALAVALVGIPLSAWGAEVFANGYCDRSGPQRHTVMAQKKYTSSSKNGTTYHVLLDSWRTPGGAEPLSVSGATYVRIQPGKTQATVTTRAGYLGFEWMVGYEFE